MEFQPNSSALLWEIGAKAHNKVSYLGISRFEARDLGAFLFSFFFPWRLEGKVEVTCVYLLS